MLDTPVDKIKFYQKLVEVSYMGDIRSYFKAESKDKTLNIVLGAVDLYDEIFNKYFNLLSLEKENLKISLKEKSDNDLWKKCIEELPEEFLREISNIKHNKNLDVFKEEICKGASEQRKTLLTNYIKNLNLKTSISGIIIALFSTNINKIVSISLK